MPAGQDVEFCVRARKHNVRLTYCAGAVVQHAFAPGANGLYSQFYRYGMFERHMTVKHPEYMSWLSVSSEISSFGGLPVVLAADNEAPAADGPCAPSTADGGTDTAGSNGAPGHPPRTCSRGALCALVRRAAPCHAALAMCMRPSMGSGVGRCGVQ